MGIALETCDSSSRIILLQNVGWLPFDPENFPAGNRGKPVSSMSLVGFAAGHD